MVLVLVILLRQQMRPTVAGGHVVVIQGQPILSTVPIS